GGEKFGCRVVGNGASMLLLTDVAIVHGGQAGLERAAVLFDRLAPLDALAFNLSGNGTVANPSALINSALSYSMDSAVELVGSGVKVAGNVMYQSYQRSTVLVSGSGHSVTDNLAACTIKDITNDSAFNDNMPVTFDIPSSANRITGNVAAGSDRAGWKYYGQPCSGNPASFANNAVHSSTVGAWLRASPESAAAGCTAMVNFTAYLNWDFGIISTRGIDTDVRMTGVSVADTKFAGILVLRLAAMTETSEVIMTNTTLVGQSGPHLCSMCNFRRGSGAMDPTASDPGCHPNVAPTSYNHNSPFTPSKGFLGSVFALKFTPGPEKYPWDGLKAYETIYGFTRLTGTTLANFYGPGGCDGDFHTAALGNHAKAPEAFHPVFMQASNVVDVSSDGLLKLTGPDPAWRNEADCDTINWSRDLQRLLDRGKTDDSMIELNCAGPNHVNIRDVDGSLTGVVGSILGQNNQARSFPYDQGTPLTPGPCQFNDVWSGYQCVVNSTDFELDTAFMPQPIPSGRFGGVFGDPQHFVLETRDGDSEDRNFSPVMFNTSSSVDLAVAAMDHGWCFAYTCQKRLSTFWTYLPSNQLTTISFTGTPSKVYRLHWPYADPDAQLLLRIDFQSIPNRRFVWSPGLGRVTPLASGPPNMTDGTPHGSFFWDQGASLFTVKMKGGGEPLEVRSENAVQVSQSLAITVDQFFDVKELFLKNLAFLLGIPVSRIQIVSVVPGSTNVVTMVYDDPAKSVDPIPEPAFNTSRNLDAGTAAQIAANPTLGESFLLPSLPSQPTPLASLPSQPSSFTQASVTLPTSPTTAATLSSQPSAAKATSAPSAQPSTTITPTTQPSTAITTTTCTSQPSTTTATPTSTPKPSTTSTPTTLTTQPSTTLTSTPLTSQPPTP
ncbi:hypothetical protein QJQ45_028160, partial [Haematococcus lacustris]